MVVAAVDTVIGYGPPKRMKKRKKKTTKIVENTVDKNTLSL
jgi:hypothetical protein